MKITKGMYEKANIIVPHVRDHYREIIIVATIWQVISVIAGLILLFYAFNFSSFLYIPAFFAFLYFIHISIQKNNVKVINKEIRRQIRCKKLSKNK